MVESFTYILIGDLGGTNCRFELHKISEKGPHLEKTGRFKTQEQESCAKAI